MNTPSPSFIGRARSAVPEGTFVVGLGMVVAAAAAYIIVIIVNAAVGGAAEGNTEYAGFAVFWSLLFIVGPGLFLPLEQEVARAISQRRTENVGSAPVVKKAAAFGLIMATILVVASAALSVFIVDHLFHGSRLLLAGFVIGLIGFAVMHLVRGVCSGNGRFMPYGVMIGSEGLIRLVLVVVLAMVGTDTAGPYGIAMGIAPFIAAVAVFLDGKGLLKPGPPAAWSEISTALSLLLVGSVLAQALAYSALLVVNVSQGNDNADVARSFTNAFFVARIPVLMFMAVQAALLPRLARLAAAEAHLDFRAAFKRLLVVVFGVAVLGTIVAATIGPFIGKILFSPEGFQISNLDLGVLAAGSGAFIIGQTVAQALIALRKYAHVAVSLLAGCIGFGMTIAALNGMSDIMLEAALAFFVGALVATVCMLISMAKDITGPVPDTSALITAIEQEAIEI